MMGRMNEIIESFLTKQREKLYKETRQ